MTHAIEDDELDLDQFISKMREVDEDDDLDLDQFIQPVELEVEAEGESFPSARPPSLYHVSGSSILGRLEAIKQMRGRELLRLLAKNPAMLAEELLEYAGKNWAPFSLLDGLTDPDQLMLFHTLMKYREQGQMGDVTLILRPPVEQRLAADEELHLHLEGMEPDSIVFIFLDMQRRQLEYQLRRRGLKHGTHYEIITKEALLDSELAVMRRLLSHNPTSPLFIVRKLKSL